MGCDFLLLGDVSNIGRNPGGLSPPSLPKSSVNRSLLPRKAECPPDGYGGVEVEDHDEDEARSASKKLFSKSNVSSRSVCNMHW